MNDQEQDGAIVAALIRASGLALSPEQIDEVRALYERFAPERRALAAVDVEGIEPMTIVALPAEAEREP